MNFGTQKPPLPTLELTPLIDVVFLLLIFFMVSTQLNAPLALPIQLPEAQAIAPAQQEAKRLVIGENGAMMLGSSPLKEDWKSKLKVLLQDTNRAIPIQIAADQLTPHFFVVHAMDALSGLGFEQLQIVAEEKSP